MIFRCLNMDILATTIVLHKCVTCRYNFDLFRKHEIKEFLAATAEKEFCRYLNSLSSDAVKEIEALYLYAKSDQFPQKSDKFPFYPSINEYDFEGFIKEVNAKWKNKRETAERLCKTKDLHGLLVSTFPHLGLFARAATNKAYRERVLMKQRKKEEIDELLF